MTHKFYQRLNLQVTTAAQRHIGAVVDYAIIYAREYFDRREQYPPAQAVRGRGNL